MSLSDQSVKLYFLCLLFIWSRTHMTATKRGSFCPSLSAPRHGCKGNTFIQIFLKWRFFLSQSALLLPLNLASPLPPPPPITRFSGSLLRGNRRTERLAAMFQRSLQNRIVSDETEPEAFRRAASGVDRHVNGEEKCPQAIFTFKSYLFTKLHILPAVL